MTNARFVSLLIFAAATALPASAAPGHESITTQQVATAINGMGMKVAPEQVTLLADVVASTSTPNLKVESMEHWGADRMRVRLNCANHEDCLPFYVSIKIQSGMGQSAAEVALPLRAPAALPGVDVHPPVVRAGSPATLVLEGDHVHIKVAVVCLENGVAGQKIRVMTADHTKTFTALVVDNTVLRGSL
jgi:Chaperone for flagella basal body P-ring formation